LFGGIRISTPHHGADLILLQIEIQLVLVLLAVVH
jgi:hypothetical protein